MCEMAECACITASQSPGAAQRCSAVKFLFRLQTTRCTPLRRSRAGCSAGRWFDSAHMRLQSRESISRLTDFWRSRGLRKATKKPVVQAHQDPADPSKILVNYVFDSQAPDKKAVSRPENF